MIQVLDWLYENELRHYPLKETGSKKDLTNTVLLGTNVILDAQFVVTDNFNISITNITNDDDTDVVFTLSNGEEITISKTNDFPFYHRTDNGNLLVIGKGVTSIPIGSFNFNTLVFEESTVLVYKDAWLGVTNMSFASIDPMDGDLIFREGYQFDLFSSLQNIQFSAGSVYGKQIGCTKFSDYPEDCDDIISSINGVGPDGNKELFLKAGPGFVVWDDPPNHRIYVGFAFTSENDICGDIPPFPI